MSETAPARLALVRRLMDGGSFDAAEAAIADILDTHPNDGNAFLLRAELLLRRGDIEAAESAFRDVSDLATLSHQAATAAHAGLGTACRGLGKAEEALRFLAMAIDKGSVDTRTWLGLSEVFFAMGEWTGLTKLAHAARAVIGLDGVTAAAVTLLAAVAAYGRGDFDECRSELCRLSGAEIGRGRDLNGLVAWRHLIEAKFGARSLPEHRPMVATLGYREYLTALLSFHDAHADLYSSGGDNVLHLVGDSHSLAPAHTRVVLDGRRYVVRPHIVIGAKVWHLARHLNPSPSLQRTAFERVAATLPAGEPVVSLFGEIDCRVREGLFPYLRTHPEVDRDAHCHRIAESYTATLAEHLATNGRDVLVCGVPVPVPLNVDKAGEHRDEYLAMIVAFNQALRDAATAREFRFLDPYGATAGADGHSNGLWRLDVVHLTPDFFAELLSEPGSARPEIS